MRKQQRQEWQYVNEVADEQFQLTEEEDKDNNTQGLRQAHEQVSDAYREGTIDQTLE